MSSVYYSHCTLKNTKRHFSALRHLEHSQLRLDKFSTHENRKTDRQTDKQTDAAENIHLAPLCYADE